ncbi:hypothetical protein DFH09DRAFT_1332914 [Mycena vulgaris]|nr:hypothetical protein DFH09DRAFT_1332914 [Mycena vulgaris]
MQDRTAETTVPRAAACCPSGAVTRPHAGIQQPRHALRDAWETLGLARRALALALAPAWENQCGLLAGTMSPVVVCDVGQILLDDGSCRELWERAGLRVMRVATWPGGWAMMKGDTHATSPLLELDLYSAFPPPPFYSLSLRPPLHLRAATSSSCDDLELAAALPPLLPSLPLALPPLTTPIPCRCVPQPSLPPSLSRSRSRSQGASGARSLFIPSLHTHSRPCILCCPAIRPSIPRDPLTRSRGAGGAHTPSLPSPLPSSILRHPSSFTPYSGRAHPFLHPLAHASRASRPAHPLLLTSASPGPARAGPSPPSLTSPTSSVLRVLCLSFPACPSLTALPPIRPQLGPPHRRCVNRISLPPPAFSALCCPSTPLPPLAHAHPSLLSLTNPPPCSLPRVRTLPSFSASPSFAPIFCIRLPSSTYNPRPPLPFPLHSVLTPILYPYRTSAPHVLLAIILSSFLLSWQLICLPNGSGSPKTVLSIPPLRVLRPRRSALNLTSASWNTTVADRF